MAMTDIVIATCDRLGLLQRTLAHLWARTATPYRLTIIDDASTEGNAYYACKLLSEGRLAAAYLRGERAGISANLRMLAALTRSDPIVYCDDDILCPRISPDWLSRGLEAMGADPSLGLLALNSPECNINAKRGPTTPGRPVSYCRNVAGSYLFVRRDMLATCQPPDGVQSPVKQMCYRATAAGWKVGYLTDIYCQHVGDVSVRLHNDLSADHALVYPVNEDTLEPPDAYKG